MSTLTSKAKYMVMSYRTKKNLTLKIFKGATFKESYQKNRNII